MEQFSILCEERKCLLKAAGIRDVQVTEMSRVEFNANVDSLICANSRHFVLDKRFAMREFLGQEFDLVFVYIDQVITPNLFFGCISTLISGGQLFVAYENAPSLPYFWQRVIDELHQFDNARLTLKCLTRLANARDKLVAQQDKSKLMECALNHSLVCITAPRGFGKSAFLGELANQLIQLSHKVVICAPSRKSLQSFYKQLIDVEIKFVTPDNLHKIDAASAVLIDEAANCPQKYILENFRRFKFCALATTLDGYEGQGLGFKQKILSFHVKHYSLDFCWRNSEYDQLYRWQLKYCASESGFTKIVSEQIPAIEMVLAMSSSELSSSQMAQATQLLRAAHYRTTPNDLLQLSENGNHYCLASYKSNIIGIAVFQTEKIEIDPVDIIFGTRRPVGNVLLQSLLTSTAMLGLAKIRAIRIIRIAVHPDFRKKKIGSQIVSRVVAFGVQRVDAVGTVFSSKPESNQFWLNNDFKLVDIGLRQSPWLSQPSFALLHPLTTHASELSLALERRLSHFLAAYAQRYSASTKLFHVKQTSVQTLSNESICFSIASVLFGHRDVLRLVPELINHKFRDETMEACIDRFISQLESDCCREGVDLFSYLENKAIKKRAKQQLSDTLDQFGLLELVIRASKFGSC